jgi:hypothetical protein
LFDNKLYTHILIRVENSAGIYIIHLEIPFSHSNYFIPETVEFIAVTVLFSKIMHAFFRENSLYKIMAVTYQYCGNQFNDEKFQTSGFKL